MGWLSITTANKVRDERLVESREGLSHRCCHFLCVFSLLGIVCLFLHGLLSEFVKGCLLSRLGLGIYFGVWDLLASVCVRYILALDFYFGPLQ